MAKPKKPIWVRVTIVRAGEDLFTFNAPAETASDCHDLFAYIKDLTRIVVKDQ